MSRHIPETLRLATAQRAGYRCEYCRVFERDMVYRFQGDHIISRKHGGETILENLAYACSTCNQNKGPDLGTYLPGSKRLVRLFNPRRDHWSMHFELNAGQIIPLTKIGAATVKVLDLNHPDRIILRRTLMDAGCYP